ncbi:MAG: chorismate synthase [Spirochaetaceae bacterium]|nr:chorismate synthase [Spirochaetaceae bacterium]
MHANTQGNLFSVTTFGESRGVALGAVIDGCPAGIPLSEEDFVKELQKRKPQFFFETERVENDIPLILSGVFRGMTLGTPIAVLIKNDETSECDYKNLEHIFRPGHADKAWQEKFGLRDFRGGGRSSGRETVARIIAGVVAKKLLHFHAIQIKAYPVEVAGLPCKNGEFDKEILAKLKTIKEQGNSCGGLVKCEITNVPSGLGEPVFSKLDAELAKAMLSIGSIKGIEFGCGFEFAKLDGLTTCELDKNMNGGIIGGISTGEPIYFTVVVKPPSSISLPHDAYTDTGTITKLQVAGRHDICLVRRVAIVVEAMTAIVVADFLLQSKTNRINKDNY